MQTLEELKASLAAEEAQEQPVVDEQDVERVELEEEAAESEVETEAQGEDTEEWLRSDSTQAVPLSKHVEVKHKFKARLSDKDNEIEQLKAELAQLKAGGVMNQQPQQQAPIKPPKLSDFDYDEEKYAEAMADYSAKLIDSRLNSYQSQSQQEQQQQLAKQRREQALDSHYERAAQLAQSMGDKFTFERYESAERNVRQQLHQITGNGDTVADEMIARLGDGSAKVIAHLGINSSAMDKLKASLVDDPSGLKAAVYLGQLEAKLSSASTGKLSKAPAPETTVRASAPAGAATLESLRKQYRQAETKGDVQRAFDLRQQAKAAGFKTTDW